MKPIRLDPDALAVVSFPTTAALAEPSEAAAVTRLCSRDQTCTNCQVTSCC